MSSRGKTLSLFLFFWSLLKQGSLRFSWRTPTSGKQLPFRNLKSKLDSSSSQLISPLVFSSPSSAARHNHSFSGASPSSHHTATTPKRQQQLTQTPGRYFDFRPSPQTRGVVGYRSTGTTPQHNRYHAQVYSQTQSASHFS